MSSRPALGRIVALSICLVLFSCLAAACATTTPVAVEINDGRASTFGFRQVRSTPTPIQLLPSGEAPSTADLIRSLPPIVPGTFPKRPDVNRPVGLRAPTIAVDGAEVVDVGVADDGYLDIPEANEVGWYKFGPTPGARGSAVLAAHIAYNGRDGVFRNLPDLKVGDEIFVQYEDATEQAFEILGIVQYDKDNLPIEDLFERTGQARLVLITCGGDFNPSLRSYDDNIIAYAIPVPASS